MDFSDWFDFSHRVKQDTTLVKEVNGQQVAKHVKGSINWLALIFTGFYAMFSQKYKTKDFLKKALIPFVTLLVINLLAEIVLGRELSLIINLVGAVWYGLMFDTWFKNQLIANGYHVVDHVNSAPQNEPHDFE